MINPNSMLPTPVFTQGFAQHQQQLSVDYNQQLSFNPVQSPFILNQARGYKVQFDPSYNQLTSHGYPQVLIRPPPPTAE